MSTSLIDPAATEVAVSGRRAEVLTQLRAAGRTQSVSDVAELTGLVELQAPLKATSLGPFVSPTLCAARLRAVKAGTT